MGECRRITLAGSQFRRAIEVEPDYAPAHHGLGEILVLNGRFDEAMSSFREAARHAPDSAATWLRLAEAIILSHQDAGTGALDEAVAFAERAADLTHFQDPAFLLTLADAYGAAGRFGRAVETLQRALDASDTAPAGDELAEHLRERLAVYRAYEQTSPD